MRKLKENVDMILFLKQVKACRHDVYLETDHEDRLNLKSILSQYVAAVLAELLALAQSWNLEFAERCGDIVGDEMERFGVHLWLAPALNIHRSIRCGTTIKHYAANNQEANRYGNNSVVSERALREIYLKGFGICVRESQPHALMTSYNLLNGQHTAATYLCRDARAITRTC